MARVGRAVVTISGGGASADASPSTFEVRAGDTRRIPGTGRFRLDPEPSEDGAADALARRVFKTPEDARVHVERVNYHLLNADLDGLIGALLDAFLAFEPSRGAGLRHRLLSGARELLPVDWFAWFQAAEAEGLDPSWALPLSRRSVLSRGMTGTSRLVTATERLEPSPARSAADLGAS